MNELIRQRFAEHNAAIDATLAALGDAIQAAAQLMIDAYRAGGGVFLFGNGGSAADAQHIAGELVGRFLLNRPALKAQALSTDTSILTCVANDFSYESIFSRQLEANAQPGDVAFALSTSGNSPNVVEAMIYAKEHGMKTIAMTGQGGGKCAELADVLLAVPAPGTPRAQEAGMLIYHILCEIVEAELAK